MRRQILLLLNTPQEAFAGAVSYISVCMLGIVFIYGYNMASAALRGMGDSSHPFLFIVCSSSINLILDCLFVIVLHWGVFGAGLATTISQGASFIAAFIILYKKRKELEFKVCVESFRIDKEMFRQLMKLGIPMAIQSGSIQFSKIFINSWINTYGVVVSAVTGVGNKLCLINNTLGNSVNAASSTMIGQNIGGEKYKRITQILKTSFAVNLSIAFAVSAVFMLIPKFIFGLFTSEKAVLLVAMEYVPAAVINAIASGLRSPMNALINGIGNSKLNLLVALLDGIIARIGSVFCWGSVWDWDIMDSGMGVSQLVLYHLS